MKFVNKQFIEIVSIIRLKVLILSSADEEHLVEKYG